MLDESDRTGQDFCGSFSQLCLEICISLVQEFPFPGFPAIFIVAGNGSGKKQLDQRVGNIYIKCSV